MMGDGFQFIDIVLFAMIAAFLILRLRSVLGRHKDDGRPAPRPAPVATDDNVVRLPDRNGADRAEPVRDAAPRADVAAPEKPAGPLDPALTQIRIADPKFDLPQFLRGARAAFEMILQAYAAADRKTLKQLLSDEVFADFDAAIRERETKNESLENTLIRIVSTDAVHAEMDGNSAHIAVKIVSEQVNVTKNAAGEPVDGNANHITDVTDIWTFARDLRSRDPNWKLVGTGGPV
jgi:predicted lipid-binding transport protein (Tim44 family)